MSEKRESTIKLIQNNTNKIISIKIEQEAPSLKPVTLYLEAKYNRTNVFITKLSWDIEISYRQNGKVVSVPFKGIYDDIPRTTMSLETSRIIPADATKIIIKNNSRLPSSCVTIKFGSDIVPLSGLEYADTTQMISSIGETPKIKIVLSDKI